MNTYNITAQVYEKFVYPKQTLLINQVIEARSEDEAAYKFEYINVSYFKVLKIYSIEAI